MSSGAAHLVDYVVPEVAVRQWVLSVPWPRRYLFARRPDLCAGDNRGATAAPDGARAAALATRAQSAEAMRAPRRSPVGIGVVKLDEVVAFEGDPHRHVVDRKLNHVGIGGEGLPAVSRASALVSSLLAGNEVMMRQVMCKSGIHRTTATEADLHCEGSVTIDQTLLRAAGCRVGNC